MKIPHQILDLFFPNTCLVCKEKLTENNYVCENCKKNLIFLNQKKCYYCGENLANNGICESCKKELFFDGFVSVFQFNEVVQSLIHHFKYKEFKKIGKFFGEFLAERLFKYPFIQEVDYIIPVPLHSIKERERGFNQSLIISKEVSEMLKIPIGKNIVKRNKYTKTQTKLSREERGRNVRNAFVIKKLASVKKKKLLLIDDIFTTGSTMKSITSVLKNSGAEKVYAASIGRA